MATAAQLLADACTSGIQCLNKKQLLVVLAQATAGSMATANQLLQDACASGIACLDERQLMIALAQAANANAGGGGGGAALTVTEQDGSPNVANVTEIRVTNATLTNEGGGAVSVATGGGASTNYNLQGVVDPVAAPADPAQAWTYTNTAAGTFWIWDIIGATWTQLV